MSAFILGGLGFLGYHVTKKFASENVTVNIMNFKVSEVDYGLPDNVHVTYGDFFALSDDEIVDKLKGNDCFVYAAGADERSVCPIPGHSFFYKHNVLPTIRMVRLCGKAGVKKFVLFGSYFSHMAREWPEYNLYETPYVQNRLAQEHCAVQEGQLHGVDVMTLRLPYIFGTTPGNVPLWSLHLSQVKNQEKVHCSVGSTAAVTVGQVADATYGAYKYGTHGKRYAICGKNISFKHYFQLYVDTMGQKETSTVVPVPAMYQKAGFIAEDERCAKQGTEHGIKCEITCEIQGRDAILPEMNHADELKYQDEDIDAAICKAIQCIKELDAQGKVVIPSNYISLAPQK